MVLAHNDEPLSRVEKYVLRARSFVDVRQVHLVTHSNLSNSVPHGWNVLVVPNWGREGYSYVRWMQTMEAHTDVAHHVWFTQSVPDEYVEDKLWARLPLLTERTGYLGLGTHGSTPCSGDLGDGFDHLGPFLHTFFYMTTHTFCTHSWTVFYNGYFVVSRKRLRRLQSRRRLLQSVRETLEHADNHTIHTAFASQKKPSTRVDPAFGYALERLWNVFFNCTRDGIPPCDIHTSGGCSPDACQCFD
jgi:hypothetical protein